MRLGALTGEVVAGAKIDVRWTKTAVVAQALVAPYRQVVGEVNLRRVSAGSPLTRTGEGLIARNWPSRAVFYVASSQVIRDYQQRGVGLALYRAAIEEAWAVHRAVVVSHVCIEEGDTSDEALRVWRALGRHYDVVALGDCKAVLGARRG